MNQGNFSPHPGEYEENVNNFSAGASTLLGMAVNYTDFGKIAGGPGI